MLKKEPSNNQKIEQLTEEKRKMNKQNEKDYWKNIQQINKKVRE
jgi:gentisate 1,2-dioxygenase